MLSDLRFHQIPYTKHSFSQLGWIPFYNRWEGTKPNEASLPFFIACLSLRNEMVMLSEISDIITCKWTLPGKKAKHS